MGKKPFQSEPMSAVWSEKQAPRVSLLTSGAGAFGNILLMASPSPLFPLFPR